MNANFNDYFMVDHWPDEIIDYIASLINRNMLSGFLVRDFKPIFVEMNRTQHTNDLLLPQFIFPGSNACCGSECFRKSFT